MAQEKQHTWQDLEAAIGQDFSGGQVRTGADPAERGAIRKFCEVLEMDCPLFHDDGVAQQHGYQGIVAPVSMIAQTLIAGPVWEPGDPTRWPNAERNALIERGPESGSIPPLPMPRTSATFATDIEVEYLAPVYVGDVLTTRGRKLVSVNVRKTRVGFGAFVVFESEIKNQRGELVAKTRNGLYHYNPGAES